MFYLFQWKIHLYTCLIVVTSSPLNNILSEKKNNNSNNTPGEKPQSTETRPAQIHGKKVNETDAHYNMKEAYGNVIWKGKDKLGIKEKTTKNDIAFK